jgi:hypothetical protein
VKVKLARDQVSHVSFLKELIVSGASIVRLLMATCFEQIQKLNQSFVSGIHGLADGQGREICVKSACDCQLCSHVFTEGKVVTTR